MSRYWDISDTYSQPSIEEMRARVRQGIAKAAKKGKLYEPVIHRGGREICHNWWGKAWCDNLERYADYASRIDRGKRYVKAGSVIDMKIVKGKIEARVQGSRSTPYKVEIRISPLSEEKCQKIIENAGDVSKIWRV